MTESSLSADLPPSPAPAFRRARNLVAVASGKGGVGKTWFSITLSHAMARAGKRVLLVDVDPQAI